MDKLIAGIISTAVFSILMQLGIGFHLTRMNFPILLGTFFSSNRSKATIFGIILLFLFGIFFSFVYFWIILALNLIYIWFSIILGILQCLFFLTLGCLLLPKCHPRMADENHGPDASKLLEPPGFLGMNYGYLTPIIVLLAHACFGLCIYFLAFRT